MSDGFTIKPVERDFKSLDKWFRMAPKEMRAAIKKRWRKTGQETIKGMKASHFSGPTGASTIRYRKKRERGASKWKHVRTMLSVKKVQFGIGDSFGGYMVLGFKGALGEGRRAHFVAMFQEFGTKHMKARAPEAAAWKAKGEGVDIVEATGAGVSDVLKTWGR